MTLPPMNELLRSLGVVLFSLSCLLALWYSRREDAKKAPAPLSLRQSALVTLLYLGIRLGLLAVTLYLRGQVSGAESLPGLADTFNRWDAPHYLWIAENGYQAVTPDSDGWLFIVFFPLYPWIVGLLGGTAEAGCVLNIILSVAGSLLLYLWMRRRGEDEPCAILCGVFYQLFPLSVFQMAPYTESLFLLLTVATLFAVSEGRWIAAGILGFFATLTRNVGVLLILPALLQWAQTLRRENWIHALRDALWLLLIPIGMLCYLGINQAVYGDPLMFMKIQKIHWYQGFGFFGDTIEYISRLFLTGEGPTRWYLWGSELIAIAATLLSLPFLLREMSRAERLYTLFYLVFILSPTWLLSYPRYLMSLAPLYPALARLCFSRGKGHAILGCGILAAFIFALILMTYGFVSGQQVL